MTHKTVTIKMSNSSLHMDTQIKPAKGNLSKLPPGDRNKFPIKAADNREPSFRLVKGVKYSVTLAIRYKDGQKYTITVDGASNSKHPKTEKTLKGGIDFFGFTFTVE